MSDEKIELEEEDLNFFSEEGSSSDEESNLSGLEAEENAVNEEIEPTIYDCQVEIFVFSPIINNTVVCI